MNTEYWDDFRNTIVTRKGGWTVGAVYSHGYSMLDELLGSASFFQVLILNITGKLPAEPVSKWLEAIYICLSWPDPRIWCNGVGSLAGTTRTSPVSAIAAGVLASDSKIYGPGTILTTVSFLVEVFDNKQNGVAVSEFIESKCKKNGRLVTPGFARPLAKGDERVDAMLKVAADLGFHEGPVLATAFEINDYLTEHYDESINLSGYIMAFLMDQGYSGKQIELMLSLCVNGGIHACFEEAASSPPYTYLPLRCDDLEYQGVPERPVPDIRDQLGK